MLEDVLNYVLDDDPLKRYLKVKRIQDFTELSLAKAVKSYKNC